MNKKFITSVAVALGFAVSCSEDFLDKQPQGVVVEDLLVDKAGVESLLIGAYSLLDGIGATEIGVATDWASAGSNWVFGSVVSDDAYKGSDAGDQQPISDLERFVALPNNPYFQDKWRPLYDGVARSNDVLKVLEKAEDISEADRNLLAGQARFLRGHYHMEAKKIFNNVPYVDDKVEDFSVPNYTESGEYINIWPQIEADFQFAIDNLPETQAEKGRATKYAAMALKAKAHMFQGEYAEAKTLLDGIISSGKFSLMPNYHDNFRIATKNNAESIFEVQMSVNDGTNGENGNWGEALNYPYTGGPGECCGFHQPSQNLVNAFKTDPTTGLPLLDNFNASDVTSDQGIESSEPFTPYGGTLDPRLDWTVGRRGIPYLDWGLHPGKNWIRDQNFSGPYAPKKNAFYKSEKGSGSTSSGWAQGPNANNYRMIRYADVLLMAAECDVEAGDFDAAREKVNMIRVRAANSPVKAYLDPKDPSKGPGANNAANYFVKTYPAGAPFNNKENALKAVRFERRLELGMEGHRFFDLVRWGIAAQVMNAYLDVERTKRSYLQGARFVAGKHEYFAIPESEIVNSQKGGVATLKQNQGY